MKIHSSAFELFQANKTRDRMTDNPFKGIQTSLRSAEVMFNSDWEQHSILGSH
jgi:hypothetical protein